MDRVTSVTRLSVALVLYLCIFFSLYGVRLVDQSVQIPLMQNPFTPLPPEGQFLHDSPLIPVIGYILGLEGKWEVYGLYGVFTLLAIVAVIVYVLNLTAWDLTRSSILLIPASLPLLHVLLFWVGKPDPVIVLCYLGFISSQSRIVRVSAVMGMMLAHLQIGLLLIALHHVIFTEERTRLGTPVLGALIGGGLYWMYQSSLVMPVQGRVGFLVNQTFSLSVLVSGLIGTALSLGLWWYVVWLVVRAKPGEMLRVVFVCGVVLIVATLVLDHTRVATLLFLPLLVYIVKAYAMRVIDFAYPHILISLGLVRWQFVGHAVVVSNWSALLRSLQGLW